MNKAEYRKNLSDMFIKSLEEKISNWEKPWISIGQHYNATTNKKYKGLNQIYLSFIAQAKGYTDPRWATFKQANDNGWRIRKGAKSIHIEYWLPFDTKIKKYVNWSAFTSTCPEERDKYIVKPLYSNVFNAVDIDGIPALQLPTNNISSMKIIDTLSENMKVPIFHDGGDSAYYKISYDEIHLSEKRFFKNDAAYASTALHELAHSTGASHRLDRNIGGGSYDHEELVAEITSAFMSANLDFSYDQCVLDNHKAYVQHWLTNIKEKPDELIMAIKEANTAADYMELKANIITPEVYNIRTADFVLLKNEIPYNNLVKELNQNHYKMTENLKIFFKDICEKSPGTTLKDIELMYKKKQPIPPEIKDTVKRIGDLISVQELMQEIRGSR